MRNNGFYYNGTRLFSKWEIMAKSKELFFMTNSKGKEVLGARIEHTNKPIEIDLDSYVSYYDTGLVSEIVYSSCNQSKRMKLETTSEPKKYVREFKCEVTEQYYGDWRRKYRNLIRLINYLFRGDSSELLITLTYKNAPLNEKVARRDFMNFKKRFKRAFKYDYDYVSVFEPSGDESWHIHILTKNKAGEEMIIDKQKLYEVWGLGWVDVEPIRYSVNFGCYFVAKLTKSTADDINGGNWKAVLKAERLDRYAEKYFRFFSSSKKVPVAEIMTMREALERVQGRKRIYNGSILIKGVGDDSNFIINRVTNQCYVESDVVR